MLNSARIGVTSRLLRRVCIATVVILGGAASCRPRAGLSSRLHSGPAYTDNGPPAEISADERADAGGVRASLGQRRDAVERACGEIGGTFEQAPGESGWCRHARVDWAEGVDRRWWLSGERVAAQTTFGPLESFDAAKARAEHVAAARWGVEELQSWAYDCGGRDPEQRLKNTLGGLCRGSRRFRDANRRTHVLIAPRPSSLWQVVLDESQVAPSPAASDFLFPDGFGSFKFGDSPPRVADECSAAGGRFSSSPPTSRCDSVPFADIGFPPATAYVDWCRQTELCFLHVSRVTAAVRETVDLFLDVRRAATKKLGPPNASARTSCEPDSTPERLEEAVRDGHCELKTLWRSASSHVELFVAADEGEHAYPPHRWEVRFEPSSSKWLDPLGI